MNKFSMRMSALLFAAVVTFPAYAMENEEQESIDKQESVVWYKKESTQRIASGVVITAAAAYALAVYMGKVPSPKALLTAVAGLIYPAAKANVNNVTPSDANKVVNQPAESSAVQPQNPGNNDSVKQEKDVHVAAAPVTNEVGFVDQAKNKLATVTSYVYALLDKKANTFNVRENL